MFDILPLFFYSVYLHSNIVDVNSNSILCPVAHLLVLKVVVEVEAGACEHERVNGDAGVATAGRSLAHIAGIYANATRDILQK